MVKTQTGSAVVAVAHSDTFLTGKPGSDLLPESTSDPDMFYLLQVASSGTWTTPMQTLTVTVDSILGLVDQRRHCLGLPGTSKEVAS